MPDLLTMKSNVRTKLRTDPRKKIITDAFLGLVINDGQRVVEKRGDWPFAEITRTFSTTTGSQQYTMSPVMHEVTTVLHQDREVPLEMMDFQQSKYYGTSSGTPYAFYIVGKRTIGFVYTPGGVRTVTLSGIRVFPPISDTTASIIPEDDQYILEEYALAQCYKTLNQIQRGNDKLGEFFANLDKMEEDYMMRVPGGDFRMKDPDEYRSAPENTFNYYLP